MTDTDHSTAPDAAIDEPEPTLDDERGPWAGLSPVRLVVLLLAVSFLAGAVGYAIAERGRDPLSSTDVGFMQDMSYHHEQAVQMSILLLDKDDVDPELKSYAQEIVIGQRYEIGLMNAILDRFGYGFQPGETVMGWMGPPLPRDAMEGLASEAQMRALADAHGAEAETLFIALMTEHHLGGLHMADWEARHGSDNTTRNIAEEMVMTQRGEVIDLDRYRTRRDLPIADGFDNPLQDQRLNPLTFTER